MGRLVLSVLPLPMPWPSTASRIQPAAEPLRSSQRSPALAVSRKLLKVALAAVSVVMGASRKSDALKVPVKTVGCGRGGAQSWAANPGSPHGTHGSKHRSGPRSPIITCHGDVEGRGLHGQAAGRGGILRQDDDHWGATAGGIPAPGRVASRQGQEGQ